MEDYSLEQFDFPLDEELIAQEPSQLRDHSRLMVLNKKEKTIEHKHFYDIIDYLRPGDVLVRKRLDLHSLISLGIIAFLKNVDIKRISYYKPVLGKYKISEEKFKENIDILTQMELINVVNHRYVFFEDQIICSYVLKTVFLDQQLISLNFII